MTMMFLYAGGLQHQHYRVSDKPEIYDLTQLE